MRQTVLLSTIAGLTVAVAAPAVAQTLAPSVKVSTASTLITTMSFSPYVAFGMLGNSPINLSLLAVNLNSNARLDGAILFKTSEKSAAYLNTPSGLPNGNYSVQLAISRVNAPAVLTITRGASTALATCSLVTSFTTTQACNTGIFSVADGQLNLALATPSGDEVTLAKVTLSQWK